MNPISKRVYKQPKKGSQHNKTASFEQLQFDYKVKELNKTLIIFQFLAVLIFIQRNFLSTDMDASFYHKKGKIIMVSIILESSRRLFKITNYQRLNGIIVFLLFIISFICFSSSLTAVGKTQKFELYEFCLALMGLHVYLYGMTDFTWYHCLAHYTFYWFAYFLGMSYIIGFNNIESKHWLGLILALMVLARIQHFKYKLEQKLSACYKRAQEAEENMTHILNLIPEGIIIFDKNLEEINFANKPAYRMVFSNEQIRASSSSLSQSSQSHQLYDLPTQDILLEQIHNLELTIKEPDGSNSSSDNNSSNCKPQKSKETISFLKLVEQLRTMKEQIEVKFPKPSKIIADFSSLSIKNQTQQLVLMKDNSNIREREKSKLQNEFQAIFFAQIAHDLRTPLNALHASNLTLLSIFIRDQYVTDILNIQKNSILFQMSLVEDILDLSKFQFNKFDLVNSWFTFENLITEVFQMSEFQAHIKGIKLISKIDIEQSIEIFSDKKRLKQVILNLITNAIKFTFKGEVRITASIEIKELDINQMYEEEEEKQIPDNQILSPTFIFQSQGQTPGKAKIIFPFNKKVLKVSVIDSGIGISETDKKNLFTLFGKLKRSNHLNVSGIGLGLTICKKICEQMHGSIEVNSQLDVGSSFSFQVEITSLRQRAKPITSSQEIVFKNLSSEQLEPIEIFSSRVSNAQRYDFEQFFSNPFSRESGATQIVTHIKNPTIYNQDLFNLQDVDSLNYIEDEECRQCNKILIVDDNIFNFVSLNLILTQVSQNMNIQNLQADQALDGIQAIDKMEKKISQCCRLPYKVIFVDLNMPRMNGIQFMEVAKNKMLHGSMNKYKDTLYILSSAFDYLQGHASYKDLGFHYQMSKPINVMRLQQIIEEIFSN